MQGRGRQPSRCASPAALQRPFGSTLSVYHPWRRLVIPKSRWLVREFTTRFGSVRGARATQRASRGGRGRRRSLLTWASARPRRPTALSSRPMTTRFCALLPSSSCSGGAPSKLLHRRPGRRTCSRSRSSRWRCKRRDRRRTRPASRAVQRGARFRPSRESASSATWWTTTSSSRWMRASRLARVPRHSTTGRTSWGSTQCSPHHVCSAWRMAGRRSAWLTHRSFKTKGGRCRTSCSPGAHGMDRRSRPAFARFESAGATVGPRGGRRTPKGSVEVIHSRRLQ